MAIKDNLVEIENVLSKYNAKLLPVVKNRNVEQKNNPQGTFGAPVQCTPPLSEHQFSAPLHDSTTPKLP